MNVIWLIIFAGGWLGWSLGANDAANLFGTAVSSRMVRWRTAAILSVIFVVLGASLQGRAGISTLQNLQGNGGKNLVWAAIAAALTVTIMTLLGKPVSTSQAVIGAIAGANFEQQGVSGFFTPDMGKIVICWIGTPIGAMLVSVCAYIFFRYLLQKMQLNVIQTDGVLRFCLILTGCYSAYALGANNVAGVSVFMVIDNAMTPGQAVFWGGICIALGIITLSKPVMKTVGRGITPLNAFNAFIVVFAQAVTVHFYAVAGVPVSTSQALVGAIVGLALLKGTQIINFKTLKRLVVAWITTPIVAAALAALFCQ